MVNEEQLKKIAWYNRNAIYNLRPKYNAINELFNKNPELKRTLLLIWTFVLKNGGFIVNNKEPYFMLTARDLTELRKKNTKYLSVTSRYMNYLTAIGLLKKIEQVMDYETGIEELTEINKAFILNFQNSEARKIKPMNTYKIEKYNAELLQLVNQKILSMNKLNIKPSNISNDKLLHKQQKEIAEHTFYNNVPGLEKKLENYRLLKNHIDRQISKNGYTTKYKALTHIKGLGYQKAAETFRFFKDELLNIYNYRIPSKADREKYSLDGNKFIITRKEI